jgi:hypothetical protein
MAAQLFWEFRQRTVLANFDAQSCKVRIVRPTPARLAPGVAVS